MKKITLEGYECERCGHQWTPRDIKEPPKCCPKCKSAYWETPRKGGIESE